MVGAKSSNLSASLEDYLEAIFNLAAGSNAARSKDIADTLGVAKPSVTGALKLLAKRGLVNYRPYGYVSLTDSGLAEASRVARKHNIIKSFFVNVLGVEMDVAQQAACRAEHALGPDVIARLLCFIEFVSKNNKEGYGLADAFRKFCKNRLQKSHFLTDDRTEVDDVIGLNELKPGQKARIVKIIGRSGVNKRIADMGIVPGTMVEVERIAPLGDPIDVKVKGYHLSLRKEEASKIMVKLGQ